MRNTKRLLHISIAVFVFLVMLYSAFAEDNWPYASGTMSIDDFVLYIFIIGTNLAIAV